MSVSAAYASTLTVTEVLSDATLSSSGNRVIHDANSTSGTYNSGSTPAITKRARLAYTMTAGAATIDLRALIGTNGAAVDGNGLRAQFVKIINPITNANAITISKGASNGYDGLGSSFSIALVPGGELLVKLNDGGADIGATNKTLDLAGVGSQVITGEVLMG